MRAGLLTERVMFQRPDVAQDGYGASDVEWIDVISTRADVTYNNGNRVNEANEVAFSYEVNFTVRLYHDIDERMRVIWCGNKYRILSVERDKQTQRIIVRTELIND